MDGSALFDVPDLGEDISKVCGVSRFHSRGRRNPQPSCGRLLPLEAFYRSPRSPGGYTLICRTCQWLWQNYRMTYERYVGMVRAQGGYCAIEGCMAVLASMNNGNIDHDHACDHPDRGTRSCGECVRGILCTSCNIAVGFLESHPQKLGGWLTYLEREVEGKWPPLL